jgi:hypothetical protein
VVEELVALEATVVAKRGGGALGCESSGEDEGAANETDVDDSPPNVGDK